ncbi:hypothetical protein Clocel_0202 [Clostridium cellulovorans 743B]|uniref:Uncharacterized protein n=1 Tax=Clostridium cellulovorans (strain ATCC 35296 / DSM 3052 / OCM 3 / 743B) TaxID=573061 RepID=D9SNW5_CLOC7|nr:hypothetical protein Clocel_0202 [Clostridium cellulovorans 743B]
MRSLVINKIKVRQDGDNESFSENDDYFRWKRVKSQKS